MNYRYDINSLRAISILAVLSYHYFPNLITGGFIGVDVFFVISGYLMTNIIITSIEKKQFDILHFYKARFLRIVPGLLAMLTILTVYGWFSLLPEEYKQLAKHSASTILFISNFVYFLDTDYFSASIYENWLVHTWSLSVEWQFYIIYPLLVYFIFKHFSLLTLKKFLILVFLLSFTSAVFTSNVYVNFAYYLPITRVWEMTAGGLTYFYCVKDLDTRNRKVYSIFGFLVIIFSALYVNSDSNGWPGVLTLFPVLATCVIIMSNVEFPILKNGILNYIGRISYSLYLYHWIILVYIVQSGYGNSSWHLIIGVILSFLLSTFSYYLVERKIQEHQSGLKITLTLSIAYFSFALFAFSTEGFTSPLRAISTAEKASFVDKYKRQDDLYDKYWLKCNVYDSLIKTGHNGVDPECIKDIKHGVFLWGDSHAESYSYGIRLSLPDNVPFYQVTSAGCNPSIRASERKGKLKYACDYSNNLAIDKISHLSPKLVIMAQNEKHEHTDWEEIAGLLYSFGVEHVILIGPLPHWNPSLPLIVAKRHWNNELSISDRALSLDTALSNAIVEKKLKGSNVTYIDIFNSLCDLNDGIHYKCRVKVSDNNSLLSFDYAHLTSDGSRFVVDMYIYPSLKRLLND